MIVIESIQNPKIKKLLRLQSKSRERKKQGVFVVEGIQENEMALLYNFDLEVVFLCEEMNEQKWHFPEDKVCFVSKKVYQKIGYRSSTEGVIGVFKEKKKMLEHVSFKQHNLFVVLEAVEKPGNLGAILRTCDGAGVNTVFICDEKVDFHNPNVIRSSVGACFSVSCITISKEELVDWLKLNQVQILSTYLSGETQNLYETQMEKNLALVFGTESTGLSDLWQNVSDGLIQIPMKGKLDSLNVSNSVAICLYEAFRRLN